MRIAEISAFQDYSVGKIMNALAEGFQRCGIETNVYYFRDKSKNDSIYCGNEFFVDLNALSARIFDNDGFCGKKLTRNLVKELEAFKPDIVHIHCLHGYWCNCNELWAYFHRHNHVKIIWTMHDNWAFTGHCCYASFRDCNKWIYGCSKCPEKKEYPTSDFFDFSKKNYIKKRKLFTSLEKNRIIIISPSNWMDSLVTKSFLDIYRHSIIFNGIDTSIFFDNGERRERIILSVASVWDSRKNLDDVLALSKKIEGWKFIVIGKIPRAVNKTCYPNVTFISRTKNQKELVKFYNSSQFLFNPTKSDNLPTVNIEAQLCGLNVITYPTGGTKNTDCGKIIYVQSISEITESFLDKATRQHRPILKDSYYLFSNEHMVDQYGYQVKRLLYEK